jgi:hypothetical protein
VDRERRCVRFRRRLRRVRSRQERSVRWQIGPASCISLRGCGRCLSGIPFVIREDLEQVARVSLKSGVVQHELVK